MLLAIDIGNSQIKWGIFKEEKLLNVFRLETKDTDFDYLKHEILNQVQDDVKKSIENIIISSVVPSLNEVFEQVCLSLFKIKPSYVHDLVKPEHIKVKNPHEVGADLLCNVIAAYHIYGGPSVVVDLGTATTFDSVDKEGNFLGTAIAPGMQIAHKALLENTALLSEVPLEAPESVIGTDTTTAIQSGVVLGYVSLVEGMVARFKKELGQETTIIATGGLCKIIAKNTTVFDHVDAYLTLRGIQVISNTQSLEK